MDLDRIPDILHAIPLDWILLGVFALVVSFDTMRAGAGRAITLALALPAAMLIFASAAKAVLLGSIIGGFSSPTAQALLFVALAVALYILIARIVSSHSGGGQPIQSAVAGVALTVVFITIWLQVPALDSIWHFGWQVQGLFAEQYRFWWLICSYLALSFARAH